MLLKNHRIEGVGFARAAYVGAEIIPEIVILHDTAGRLDKGNSAAYLASANPAKASAHFVVERDGSITQLVPTNRRANHAGESSYHGRTWCNEFSIGIEIVNPGKMRPLTVSGAVAGRAWFGETYIDGENDITVVLEKTAMHGSGAWMDYAPAQIEALLDLLGALFAGIPTLNDITTHWYVSPGRKVDPGPQFPLDHVRARVLGRDDPANLAAEVGSEPADDGEMVTVCADALNMRRWPSLNPNIVTTIPRGAIVPVLRRGNFGDRSWLCVFYDGREGWIVSAYTKPI